MSGQKNSIGIGDKNMDEIGSLHEGQLWKQIAVVTLHTFALRKLDLLTLSLGKLNFSSVTNFSLNNLPGGNSIVWSLDMSLMSSTTEFPWTATPKLEQGQIQIPR